MATSGLRVSFCLGASLGLAAGIGYAAEIDNSNLYEPSEPTPKVIEPMTQAGEIIALPPPRLDSDYSLERTLRERRTVRTFGKAPLTLAEVAQLLWAAQGVTSTPGLRTAPSAGALYPLEVYLLAGHVNGLAAGVYQYAPEQHGLKRHLAGDRRSELAAAALGQSWVQQAAAVIVFTAAEARITWKYRERGIRYLYIEAGHAAQNVLLQAVACGLSAAVVGAFDDRRVEQTLQLPKQERVLYLTPVGRR